MNTPFRAALAAILVGVGAVAMTVAAPAPPAQALDNQCGFDGTVCSEHGVRLTNEEFAFFYGESWRNRNIGRGSLVGRERPLRSYGGSRAAWSGTPSPTGGWHETKEERSGATVIKTVAKNGYLTSSGWAWRQSNPDQVALAGGLVRQWESEGKVALPGLPAGQVPPPGQDLVEVLYDPHHADFEDPDYLLDMLFLGGLRTKLVGELSWYNSGPRRSKVYNGRTYHRFIAKIYTPLEVSHGTAAPPMGTCNPQPFAVVAPGATVDISAAVTGMNCAAPNGSPMRIKRDPSAQASFGQLGTRPDGTGLTYQPFYNVNPNDPSSAPTDGKKDTFLARLVADDLSVNRSIVIEAHITNRPQCTGTGTHTPARPTTHSVKRGSSVLIPLSDLCSDLDTQLTGETLAFDQAHPTGAGHGTVAFTTDAQGKPALRYSPNADHTGADSISIQVRDTLGGVSQPASVRFDAVHPELVCAGVSIKPNLPPINRYENWVPVDVSLDCMLENYAPTLGVPITYQITDPPYGTLSNVDLTAGRFTYLSDDPNAHPFDGVGITARWGGKTFTGTYRLVVNCGVRACDPPPWTE